MDSDHQADNKTDKESDHKEILYIERAKNELDLAKAIFKLSTDNQLKLEFELKDKNVPFLKIFFLVFLYFHH